MLDISQVSLKDLIGFAIRSEIDSNKVYSDLANRYSNPLLKEKFNWLAYEEKKHKMALEKLAKSLYGKEKITIPEKPSEELFKTVIIKPSSTLVDLLFQAMESEKKAEEFYASLVERVETPYKSLLEYLSQVEHSHYVMLKGEYTLAQEFEDYGEEGIDKVVT